VSISNLLIIDFYPQARLGQSQLPHSQSPQSSSGVYLSYEQFEVGSTDHATLQSRHPLASSESPQAKTCGSLEYAGRDPSFPACSTALVYTVERCHLCIGLMHLYCQGGCCSLKS